MPTGENQIVVYQPDETIRLDVRLENETVWLRQEQIANLFGTKRPAITKHLANIYKSGELDREGTCSILEHMGNDDRQSYRTMFYNLDAILSVGYRVNSRNATLFRRWATQVLKAYLLKGFAINARLNQLEDKVDRRLAKTEADIAELKDKVGFFVQTKEFPLQGVFYDGQLWDARALVLKLISSAKRSLILIDNWATSEVLDLFTRKRAGVKVTFFTSEHFKRGGAEPQDFRGGHRDLQRAVPEARRPLHRVVPRPLPYHRRQGTLSCRCFAEGLGTQVLWLYANGCGGDPTNKERGFCGEGVQEIVQREVPGKNLRPLPWNRKRRKAMSFWYMQLHPGGGQDSPEDRWSRREFNSERMLQTIERYKMIGLGSEDQWENDHGQIKRFKEEMEIGDIVMCAEGVKFFALVKIVSDAFYRGAEELESDDDYRWFGLVRNVEVLSTNPTPFERLYDEKHAGETEKGRKPHCSHCNPRRTLCQWKKNKFIQFWYEHIGRIPDDLICLHEEIDTMQETNVVSQSAQRRGQDKIRKVLLEIRRQCEVSHQGIPELLRASHIKPWKDSSNDERLDLENVLLLAVNYDAAFDARLISFDAETGGVIISPTVPIEQLRLLGIDCRATLPKPSSKRAKYLKWHNAHVFKLI